MISSSHPSFDNFRSRELVQVSFERLGRKINYILVHLNPYSFELEKENELENK